MRHSDYLVGLAYASRPRTLAGWVFEDPAYTTAWFAFSKAWQARVDEFMKAGEFRRAKAFMQANPTPSGPAHEPIPDGFIEPPAEADLAWDEGHDF